LSQVAAEVAAVEADPERNHGTAHTLLMEVTLPVQMVCTAVIAEIQMVVVLAAAVVVGMAVPQAQSIDLAAPANVVHSQGRQEEIFSAIQRPQLAMDISLQMAQVRVLTISFIQQRHHVQRISRALISTQLLR
jgi:hypothetical protein